MRGSRYPPNDADRNTVKSMAACGFPEEIIASCLGIAPKTLRKHFRQELDTSVAKANAAVGNALFKMATSGEHPAATIFWMKTRMQWRETSRHELTGADGGDIRTADVNARQMLLTALEGQPQEVKSAIARKLLAMDGRKLPNEPQPH